MKVLFIITSAIEAVWLSEVTHPYWHLIERGVEVDFSSSKGGKVVWDEYSDPYVPQSQEADDLVSKGFLSDEVLTAKLNATLVLKDVQLETYDAVHVTGGRGALFDFYPNEDIGKALEHFWANGKAVGAICHGTVALCNLPHRIRGLHLTGYSLREDLELERLYGSGFVPQYPQRRLEESGALYTEGGLYQPWVVIDGKLVTGQNQQSASEYAISLLHVMTGTSPVSGS